MADEPPVGIAYPRYGGYAEALPYRWIVMPKRGGSKGRYVAPQPFEHHAAWVWLVEASWTQDIGRTVIIIKGNPARSRPSLADTDASTAPAPGTSDDVGRNAFSSAGVNRRHHS